MIFETLAKSTGRTLDQARNDYNKTSKIWTRQNINLQTCKIGIDEYSYDKSTEVLVKILPNGDEVLSTPDYHTVRREEVEWHKEITKLKEERAALPNNRDHTTNARRQRLSEKIREYSKYRHDAGKTAAFILLSERNKYSGLSKLDLHWLHQKEALEAVKNKLSDEHKRYLISRGIDKVQIVTGHGRNTGFFSPVKESIEQWLKQRQETVGQMYIQQPHNPGCFVVYLKRHD